MSSYYSARSYDGTATNVTLDRHYVAFVRKALGDNPEQTSWVLFNDEKVVEVVGVEEMKKFAYVYFFKRV